MTGVPRSELLERLRATHAPIVVVCGPAGSGKTSLVVQWVARLQQAGSGAIWVGFERHDDEPERLWGRVLEALRGDPRFPPGTRLHQLRAPSGEVPPGFIAEVVAELAEAPGPLWLLLDDVHVLRSDAAASSLDALVRQLPDQVRLLLSSRAEPPIGLPRLRVEGRVLELRADDLALTRSETAGLLRSEGVRVSAGDIAALHARTEGWAAGIRIAAVALAGATEPRSFVERFGGDDHQVAEYLVSEVLDHLPAATRELLLRTSVCGSLHIDLARRLSQRTDAAVVLDGLERSNVFTCRTGRARDTYRYHELFRTFLRAELHRTDPGLERQLHATAAEWQLAHGRPLHAMDHLSRNGNVERLVQVAAAHGLGVILDGWGTRVLAMLARLDPHRADEPTLALLGVAAALQRGEAATAQRWLSAIDLPPIIGGGDQLLAALAATLGLACARSRPAMVAALEVLETTRAGSTGHPDHDLLTWRYRGVARYYAGRYPDALHDLERAVDVARRTGRPTIELNGLTYLAGASGSASRFVDMQRHATEAIALARWSGWARSPAVAHAHFLLAWSAHLRGDPWTAAEQVESAREVAGREVSPDVELANRSIILLVAARGETPYEALVSYRAAFLRLVGGQRSSSVLALVIPEVVRICLDLGERHWASEFVGTALERIPDEGEPRLLRAMLLHDAGRPTGATRLLEPLIRRGEGDASCHLLVNTVRAQVLAAVIGSDRGNVTASHHRVQEALAVAATENLLQPFLEEPGARGLLAAGLGRFGRHEAFAQQVLRQGGCDAPGSVGARARLTPGELAVLRELPSRLSVLEIAQARSVSVNTVKTHLRSVYRKLDVDGRRDAVETARLRGLL